MDKEAFKQWVEAYIDIYSGKDEFDEHHPHYWAIEKFVDQEADFPAVNWAAILTILSATPPERVLANLASGPLEELIELHGEEYIERIEAECRTNPEFRRLLHGVWETTNSEIWARVVKARLNS